MVNIFTFVHKITCSVHGARGTGDILDWGSALQHGPVLDHYLLTVVQIHQGVILSINALI